MIAFVKGQICGLEDNQLLLDIGNIGLSIAIPVKRMAQPLVVGKEIFLYTHLQIKEDSWQLYGFADQEQLRVFHLLLAISGIGAKTALAIVDGMSMSSLISAVSTQDPQPFAAITGVGKKTAQRLLLELKDHFPAYQESVAGDEGTTLVAQEQDAEVIAALKQLGYTATEARSYLLAAKKSLDLPASLEDILREALKQAYKN